jgi:hypothetical protein
MSFAEFQHSIARDPAPPAELPAALQALWHDARGDWDRAHQAVQDDNSPEGSWAHAYLHRKEGDTGNARYWYGRAGRTLPAGGLDTEWAGIARALLGGR